MYAIRSYYGHVTVTIQNLTVVRADAEKNILLIKGNVPGANKSLVVIKNAHKKQKPVPDKVLKYF